MFALKNTLLTICLSLATALLAADKPVATRGVIDLRSANLSEQPVELKGEWQLRWQSLHVTNPAAAATPPVYARAPRAWNNEILSGNKLPGTGYATYSLRVLLPALKSPVGLTMNEQGTAVRLIANGKEVGSMGSVSTQKTEAVPDTRPLTVFLTERTDTLDIDVQISNFDYRKGGMWNGIFIGSRSAIQKKIRTQQLLEVFAAGCLLIIATYHLGIYVFYRQGRSALLFALFCLTLFIRLISTSQRILPEVIPGISFQVYSRLEFLSWFFSIPLGVHYSNAMFNYVRSKWFIPFGYALGIVFSLTLLLPSEIYSHFVVPSQMALFSFLLLAFAGLFRLWKHKPPALKLFLFGAVVLALGTANDILYTNEIWRTIQLGPFGVLIFIFCHAMVLSRRLYLVFKEKDEIQKLLNEKLVDRIQQKTSELRHARTESKAKQQQFLNVVNNIPGITYRCAPEAPWILYFVSDEIQHITGYATEDFIGGKVRTIASIIHPDDLNLVAASDRASANQRYRLTYRMICADGRIIWVEDSGQAVFDDEGNLVWLDGVMLDVTARKTLELEMQTAREKAEAANAAKSNFLAIMSHELRTPLHGVIGMTSVLKQTPLTREQTEYADIIENSSYVLLSLINDILDLSKIESGKVEIEKIEFDIRQLAEDMLNMAGIQARQKGLLLNLKISPDIPQVLLGDSTRLRQILANLVGNAVKFTARGEVSLEIARQNGLQSKMFLCFKVNDTGIGIPPENLELIFQPFRQADETTTRNYGGTGLGLTISKQLTELLGGTISVTSSVGVGSVFQICMPFDLPTAQLSAKAESPSDSVIPMQFTDFKGRRVLLAEDDPINQIVSRELMQHMGCSVQIAENGFEVLRCYSDAKPEIIFMDCMMPGMDGYEATAKVRELEAQLNLPRTPIVALTANALPSDREKCLAAGMDDFLAKPFQATDIETMLKRWAPAAN